MADFVIPVSEGTDPFLLQVELDGVFFDLAFRFNLRENMWYMNVGKEGSVIINGVKLVCTDDLLSQYTMYTDLPEGSLFIYDLEGKDSDPDGENFGVSVQLRYREAA